MPVRKLKDSAGEYMTVADIDGNFIFNWPLQNLEDNFRSISNWKTRDDDIYLCTYPKSGSHWTREIITMLLNNTAERIWLPFKPPMEFLTREEYENMPSPRVVTTHLRLDQLPKDLVTRKCKIVICHRNPKDVMVSFYHHHLALKQYEYKGKWENYYNRFMDGLVDFGSWFDYTTYWENVIRDITETPVHILYFEDLKQNGIEEIRKLAEFLDLKIDVDLCRSINKKCQFKEMKEDKDKVAHESTNIDMTSSFYRKGIVGDWKNWFTVAQNEYFDQEYAKRMANSKLKFTFDV